VVLIYIQIVTDPRTDAQTVKEASYVGIPCIAFADTDRWGVAACRLTLPACASKRMHKPI